MYEKPLVLVVLEGYSRSTSPVDLSDLVMAEVGDHPCSALIAKAWLGRHQVRRVARYLQCHQGPGQVYVLVGKSLGARNLFLALDATGPLVARAVSVLTIDLNYPLFFDWNWTPNLNSVTVPLPWLATRAINIYSDEPRPRKQAGALVDGAENIPVLGYDHQSIVGAPIVRSALRAMLGYDRTG